MENPPQIPDRSKDDGSSGKGYGNSYGGGYGTSAGYGQCRKKLFGVFVISINKQNHQNSLPYSQH